MQVSATHTRATNILTGLRESEKAECKQPREGEGSATLSCLYSRHGRPWQRGSRSKQRRFRAVRSREKQQKRIVTCSGDRPRQDRNNKLSTHRPGRHIPKNKPHRPSFCSKRQQRLRRTIATASRDGTAIVVTDETPASAVDETAGGPRTSAPESGPPGSPEARGHQVEKGGLGRLEVEHHRNRRPQPRHVGHQTRVKVGLEARAAT